MKYPSCGFSPGPHTNAFVVLNGIPYLVAEYVDRQMFQQLDRSMVHSSVTIDNTSEAMRAIVDISVDDIGIRGSDGFPNVIGNSQKFQNLLELLRETYQQFHHRLHVLRKGLVIRLHYQIENYRTGQVLRSLFEDFRISDRNYFVCVNPQNINDNYVVVNFCDTKVSTINQMTHGMDPMILRITKMQLIYEMVQPNPLPPVTNTQSMITNPETRMKYFGSEADMYQYHQQMQSRHRFNDPSLSLNMGPGSTIPPTWSFFNHFYHYDEETKSIVLHHEETYDPRVQLLEVACGTVQINRTFVVNPGHRIVFKFNVWKNDLTVVNDAKPIMDAIQMPIPYIPQVAPQPYPYFSPEFMNTLRQFYRGATQMDYQQNAAINRITKTVGQLLKAVEGLTPSTEEPGEDSGDSEEGETPTSTEETTLLPEGPAPFVPPPPPGVSPEILRSIAEILKNLQTQLTDLKTAQTSGNKYTPMPIEDLTAMIQELVEETSGNP